MHSSPRAVCLSLPAVPACGPASCCATRPTSPQWTGPRRCSQSLQPGPAASGCASSRPICSPGGPTAATTWFLSASGSHTSGASALSPSGHSWLTASNRTAACSSPTTPTAPTTNSWKGHHLRPSAGTSFAERSYGWVTMLTIRSGTITIRLTVALSVWRVYSGWLAIA